MGAPIKLINPPSPLFTGAELTSHTDEAVWSGIIQTVRGEVRELIGFIEFQADLTDILDQVEERFGKAPTVDKLQQEFYLLGQERIEKIQFLAVAWNKNIGNHRWNSLVLMTGDS